MRQLHSTILDLLGLMNQPQRDDALLREAGVSLDRALFPLLVVIERKGPLGVVELAALMGRDYTTVSRQVAKLESLGLVERQAKPDDRRVSILKVTAEGMRISERLDAARDRLMTPIFSKWSKRDKQNLLRLLRKFTDDFASAREQAAEDEQ